MASTIDPYKILGIGKDATDAEVKRAYRRMATKYHPDAGGDAWVFQQVQEAYEMILRQRSPESAVKTKQRAPAAPTARPDPRQSQRHQTSSPQGNPQSATRKHTTQKPINPPENESPKPMGSPIRGSFIGSSFTQHLPLQTETTVFIVINLLDIFVTYALLRFGGIESNPIAKFFYDRWNIQGMVYFKMVIVAFVSVLSQIVACYDIKRAQRLLWFGSLIVGIVVAYSLMLLSRRIR